MSYIQEPTLAGWMSNNPGTNWPLYAKYLNRASAQGGDAAVGVKYPNTSAINTSPNLRSSYLGGCLGPNERIYLCPYGIANSPSSPSTWHYIDTKRGVIVAYANNSSGSSTSNLVNNAYRSAVLDKFGRIVFIPFGQSNAAVNRWHYIDTREAALVGSNVSVQQYIPSVSSNSNGYWGGVFVPELNRIYMAPFGQSSGATWHFITSGASALGTGTYGVSGDGGSSPSGVQPNGYAGAVLAPNNRIYFVPFQQSNQTNWHYVDLATKGVVTYAHGISPLPVQNAYMGGTLAANGRIYLHPANCAAQANWHYIDTNTGNVVAYVNTASGQMVSDGAYAGGVMAPDGKIYLVPQAQIASTTWHYIDTITGTIGSYTSVLGDTSILDGNPHYGYEGGVLARDNRIYLIPGGQSGSAQWHYIQTNANAKWSLNVHMCPVYNH